MNSVSANNFIDYKTYKAMRIKPHRVVVESADSKTSPFKVSVWTNVTGNNSSISGGVHVAGRYPTKAKALEAAERAAERYGLPVINFSSYVFKGFMSGEVCRRPDGSFEWPTSTK